MQNIKLKIKNFRVKSFCVVCFKFFRRLFFRVTPQNVFSVPFLLPALGLLLIICHLAVNSPCGLYSNKIVYADESTRLEEKKLKKETDKRDIFELIDDFCRFSLFLSTPIIVLTFIANMVLTKNWRNLVRLFEKIQRRMELERSFRRKFVHHFLVIMFFLILV